MPSQPAQGIGSKNYPIQWVHIDDFSPGCYDGSAISLEHPHLSAPLGAANRIGTYCCAVLPGGALGPLPALTSSLPVSTIGGKPGTATLALLAGIAVTPYLNSGNYEIVTILEADDGTHHYVSATSYVPQVPSLHVITGPTITSATVAGFFGAPYPAYTRMNVGGSAGPPPPGPVLVFPTAVSTDARGPDGHLWVYPELLSPTSFVAQDLITGIAATPPSSITGQVITYGNRVICIAGVNYSWPAGGGINTNENFNYTDPPEASAYGNQQTIMAVEIPWGYGAWGTVSVGELLLVKKIGGGVILNGDINVPTSIIRCPGIQGVGDIVGRACPTPIGLVYCSEKQGAWVWNGGNTSQKLSRNISDDFFDLETNVIGSNNYGFNVDHWQKWILFSGNVIYDTETNSWWNLFPPNSVNLAGLPNGRDLWWYNQVNMGNQIIASPLKVDNNTDPWVSTFDNTVPSPTYQWTSVPISIGQPDRVKDIRQIVVTCSDPSNTGTSTIRCQVGTSFDQTSIAANTPIGNTPTTIRFNVGLGAQGIDEVILTLTAHNPTGNGAAPIIHAIDVGYIVKQGVKVAD